MNLSPIEKFDMVSKLELANSIWSGLRLAKYCRMRLLARVLTPLMLILGCSAVTWAQASASAELRRIDIANRQKNIKIIYTEPLEIQAGSRVIGFKGLTHTVLSETQLLQLDQQLRLRDFANGFKNDGCYAKSHLISYELSRVGIKHSKIFIYGEKYGDIQVLGNHKPILFEFHVSPVVLVRLRDGRIVPHVLDLSFFARPVQVDSWLKLFYKNSNTRVLKNTIKGPENIDPTWIENKDNPYDVDLLYRFETEIEAFLLILKRG